MRAIWCLAVLWIALSIMIMPVPSLAQAQGSGARQGGTAAQGGQVVNPLIDGVLQQMLEQLAQPPAQPPRGSGDDVQPPRGSNDPGPQIQVPNDDRTGPVITPAQPDFTSESRVARVRATITDASGVARALVTAGGERVALRSTGRNSFEADVPLAPHYRPVRMSLQAWDTRGNASAIVPVAVRRVPVCGSADGISVPLVQAVQRNLAALNRYDGGIDGLAGPNTCRAIAEIGYGARFDWPQLLRELDNLVARTLIELEVTAPAETLEETTPVRVRVVDPGNTGLVVWVRMLVDGVAVADLQNRGGSLPFDVSLAEGVTRQVTFLALDRSRTRELARQTVGITRPEALRLWLSGDALAGSRLESEAAQATLLAGLGGARTGRIYFETGQGADRGVLEFTGQPVAVTLTMPAPGARGTVTFWAESGARRVPPRRIELVRPWVHVPKVWIADLELPSVPRADPGENWTSVRLAPPVTSAPPAPPSSVRPDAAPDAVSPPPPLPGSYGWVAPVGFGVALLIGALLLFRLRGRGARPDGPIAVTSLRIVAVPDHTPRVEMSGADMPGLLLTVQPDARGQVVMVFDDEWEGAAQ